MAVTYSLRGQFVGNYGGGTVAYGPYAQTFDIGAALTAGGGQFVVADAELANVLDRYPALYRSADDGQPLIASVQPRWSQASVGAGLALDQTAFEVRRSAESYARLRVLADGTFEQGDGTATPAPVTFVDTALQAVADASVVQATGPLARRSNIGPVWVSETSDVEDVLVDLDVDLTTPERASFVVSRYSVGADLLNKLVSPDPGNYDWLALFYLVGSGTAPVTPLMARARGNSVYPLSSSGRAYGKDPQGHGLEITMGAHPSQANVVATNGNATVGVTSTVQTALGSRFEQNAEVTISEGTLPAGTTIISVSGDPGNPTSLTLSNAPSALSPATKTVVLTALASGTPDLVGVLATGNCGASQADLLGAAFQAQGQNAASRWKQVANATASAMQASGQFLRLASATTQRLLSAESDALEDGLVYVNTAFTDTGLEYSSGVTGVSGIKAVSSAVFSTAFLILNGQDIASDGTTGMKFATSSTQKTGLWGRTPIVRPSAITQTYNTATRTFNAYTADPETAAYTGLATGVGGTPYASLTDLNALRVAYENLRAFVENGLQVLNAHIDDEQAWGFMP